MAEDTLDGGSFIDECDTDDDDSPIVLCEIIV